MQDVDLDQERRLVRLEGTVAWMKWAWVTVVGAVVTSGVGWLFSKL